jgi:hypothetical protein
MRVSRLLAVLALFAVMGALALPTRRAVADPRDFRFVNNSNVTIVELYVAPAGEDDDWGDNILGGQVVESGGAGTVTFNRFSPGNCVYDIRVVASDNSASELYLVDLCNTTTVTYG